ncbi:MAG TPA: hypothetical protein VN213_00695, partial [Solirubrobacteraceae bacterium]|nr:hypothetical protein [Solirubrobacteraceae bacterium]
MTEPFEMPFATLAAARGAHYDELLIAIEREFRAVDRDAVAERLDDLSRGLFGAAREPSPDARVLDVARVAWSALPEDGPGPECWLLATA